MAIGIDVSIYAKTELLLSPLGVRIVALLGQGSDPGVPHLQFSQGARIVAYLNAERKKWTELQSPQGARIVAVRFWAIWCVLGYSPRKGREL